MAILTRKELQEAFIQKSKIFATEQLIEGLRQYVQTAESQSVQEEISRLEVSVNQMRRDAESMKASILETLSVVEDDVTRICLMLHYYEGWPWALAAGIIGVSEDAARVRARRGLNAAGVR